MALLRTPLLLVAAGIVTAIIASHYSAYLVVGVVILLMPFLVIWLVWRILHDTFTTEERFDDKFYQDLDYRRVNDRPRDDV